MSNITDQLTSFARSSPITTSLTISTVALSLFILTDYHAWTSFGTGGTPPTPSGYWRMTKIRLSRLLTSDDLRDPSPLSPDAGPRYLPTDFEAKPRSSPRPKIMSRTMPQRQHPLKSSDVEAGIAERVANLAKTFTEKYPEFLYLAPAKTEGGAADGIYAKQDVSTLNPAVKDPKNKILAGEVGHAHPADGSLHVWLSEGDAYRVVQGRWGERFPLNFVDKGWVMVYAPTTMWEVERVEEIVRAGVGWVTGQRVE